MYIFIFYIQILILVYTSILYISYIICLHLRLSKLDIASALQLVEGRRCRWTETSDRVTRTRLDPMLPVKTGGISARGRRGWSIQVDRGSPSRDLNQEFTIVVLTYDSVDPHGQLGPENDRVLPAATERTNNTGRLVFLLKNADCCVGLRINM